MPFGVRITGCGIKVKDNRFIMYIQSTETYPLLQLLISAAPLIFFIIIEVVLLIWTHYIIYFFIWFTSFDHYCLSTADKENFINAWKSLFHHKTVVAE